MKNFNLENNPKIESGFKIPDNYFESFSERLMTQLPENEPKVISLFSKKTTWIYAAAAVLIVSISIPVCNEFINSQEIEDEHIESYITENISLSEMELASLFDEKDLQKLKLDLKIEDQTIEEELITNSNLEQYLTQ